MKGDISDAANAKMLYAVAACSQAPFWCPSSRLTFLPQPRSKCAGQCRRCFSRLERQRRSCRCSCQYKIRDRLVQNVLNNRLKCRSYGHFLFLLKNSGNLLLHFNTFVGLFHLLFNPLVGHLLLVLNLFVDHFLKFHLLNPLVDHFNLLLNPLVGHFLLLRNPLVHHSHLLFDSFVGHLLLVLNAFVGHLRLVFSLL